MAPRFYSKEWCEAVRQLTLTNEEYLKKTKGFTSKYLFVVTDDPDGNDIKILWDFREGKLQHPVEYTVKPAPSDMRIGQEHWDDSISLMKNQASYETFVKIQKKELTGLAALGNKLWRMEGDIVKAMRYTANNAIIQEMQASVPCEY